MTDEEAMATALEEAQLAGAAGDVPVGAIVVRDGRVVARAHNEREHRADPTAHAEVLALQHAASVLRSWRLDGATVYVTLEPCPMCAGALVAARVHRLVFGTSDPKACWSHRVCWPSKRPLFLPNSLTDGDRGPLLNEQATD